MKRYTILATALAASTILAGVAYAADQSAGMPQAGSGTQTAQTMPAPSPAQKAVDRDVARLSADGAEAFRDMHLARVAIYDADPIKAKALVGKAQASLTKARTDETAFTKAEADLKQPPQARAGATVPSTDSKTDGKPVMWLPVDGQLTLGEDFVATAQKQAAVGDANKALAKGDQKGAAEKLKLAGIDVNFTMAVLPLDRTASDIDQAAKLLDQGKYYEANAVLKQAEDGMRFDIVDASGLPQKAATGKDGSAASGGKSSTH